MRWSVVLLAFLAAVTGCGSHAAGQPAVSPHTTGAPAAVSIQVILPSRTMTAGSQMSGRVVVDNRAGHAIHEHGCGSLFTVTLASSTYHPYLIMPTCSQIFTVPVGKSSYPVTIQASYLACNAGGAPACLPGKQRIPPLPPGDYQARLFFQVHQFALAPPAIPMRVTPR